MLGKKGLIFLFLLVIAFAAVPQPRDDGILDTVEERMSSTRSRSDTAPRSFTIRNDTGFTARNVFVRKAGETGWGENILSQPLYNGRSIFVRLGESFDASSLYSIRMVDIDGDVYAKYNIRIQEQSRIRIIIDDLEYDR